ncbi:hypothetical protein AB0V37_22845, partial [Escherichia coli]
LRSDKEGLTPEKLLVLQDHVLNYNVENYFNCLYA